MTPDHDLWHIHHDSQNNTWNLMKCNGVYTLGTFEHLMQDHARNINVRPIHKQYYCNTVAMD